MSKKEHTLKKEVLIEALEKAMGIVSTACATSGISRSSYYKWYKEDESFREKVDEIDNVKLDFVESQLFKNISDKKEKSIIFYLQHRGHKRGYIQKQNINLTSSEDDISKIEIEIIKPKGNSSTREEPTG
jgi:ACT domain-containing protein